MTNALRNFLQSASNEIAGGVSAPVDGIAWLLRKAGVPVPQNALMGSDWMAEKGLTAPVQSGVGQLAGETFGLLGPMGVAAAAPQIARGLLKGGENLAAAGTVNRGGAAAQRGIFMGDQSKTWNKAAAERAAALEKSGADPRAIWQETGTFKGPDGRWRQEIDDSAAKLREYQFTPREAFNNATYRGDVTDVESSTRAMAMRPYAGMTKNQLTDEYARTGGQIVDAALAGDKAKAMQLDADRAGLTGLLGAMRNRTYGPMSSYLKHGELGAAYPDAYKMHTRITDEVSPSLGQYMAARPGVGEQIGLAKRPTWSEDKSTMLHELQHAVQRREGFARGGSPNELIDAGQAFQHRLQEIKNYQARIRDFELTGVDPFGSDQSLEQLKSTLQKINSERDLYRQAARVNNPIEAYRRLAGEAEARAVQTRMPMNAMQRRQTFPLDSYDVPIEQLIVRR